MKTFKKIICKILLAITRNYILTLVISNLILGFITFLMLKQSVLSFQISLVIFALILPFMIKLLNSEKEKSDREKFIKDVEKYIETL